VPVEAFSPRRTWLETVSDFSIIREPLANMPAYKELWRHLRELPDFKRTLQQSASRVKPAPSFFCLVDANTAGWDVLDAGVQLLSSPVSPATHGRRAWRSSKH